MSQYKHAIRTQAPSDSQESFKYRKELVQLKDAFPNWTDDDLQTLLVEVAGDVQVAAMRIADGQAVQWGEVSRKKDKKTTPSAAAPAKDSIQGRGGDFRGGRGGGRGGRGGPGRGGATRGRGGRGGANGHIPRTDTNANGSVSDALKAGLADLPAKPPAAEEQNGVTPSTSGWTDASSQPETSTSSTSVADSSWGPPKRAPAPVTNGASTKRTWADIARKQEKPAPPPPAPAPVVAEPPAPEPEAPAAVREEPTTAQAPVWDEPSVEAPAEAEQEPEPAAVEQPPVEPKEEPAPEPAPAPEPVKVEEPPKVEPKAPSPIAPQALAAATVAAPSPKPRPASVAHRNSARYKVTDQPVVMPSSFGSGIEKVGMQFGSLNIGGDSVTETSAPEPEQPAPESPQKVQAKPQFEAVAPPPPPPATAPASSTSLSSVFQQQQQQQPPVPQIPSQPPAAQTPSSHHALPSSVSQPIHSSQAGLNQFSQQPQQQTPQTQHSIASQQQLPQLQTLPQQLQHSYNQHNLPSQLDTPSQIGQQSTQQPALQGTAHSSYFRQNESASPYFHAPTPPSAQVQDSPYGAFGQLSGQNQHQQSSHSAGGFGSADYGYNDNQRNFYDYPQQSGFGGRNALSHDDVKGLPGSQQSGASGLGPSGTQSSQQHGGAQSNAQNQQSASQVPQQGYAAPPPVPYYYHPNPGAFPQSQYYGSPYNSGYSVPQPYVNPKYPVYVQPGPGGPGSAPSPASKQPGSGLPPQSNPYNQGLYGQQVGGGYDDYQPHPHHSQQQHQHSHSLGLGQGVGSGAEYGKPLYAGSTGQMHGFMGLGSQSSGVNVPSSTAGGPRTASSPEAAYKPYGSKDVGVAGGRAGSVQQQGQGQGQPQGQSQGQSAQGGPQNQGFYGANRFGSGVGGVGAGVGGPQQSAHPSAPQHLGYSQTNDAAFYPQYQQQGSRYWAP